MLGTEEDFRALCAEAHAHGMKVILDGVFSHVGSRSAYFQQAIHDPSSPYRGWFRFQHYPDVYDSWWGITTLPCVDKMNPDFIRYMIDDEDSVAVHWLKLGADGWRLDVVDELPDAFLARLRARIRAYKPDALLIGEVWEDASNKIAYDQRRRYFTDRQLDSVMNYPWQKAILRYVRSEDDGTVLGDAIRTLAENYPPDVLQTVMNILSTHDTPRAINAILDPRDGDRTDLAQRHFTQEQLREGRQRLKLAAFLQFMLPGMPCIYYGDEAGMTGYRDPFNRKFYPWGREDGNLVSFYRSLARVKKSAPALRSGTVLVLEAGGGSRRRAASQSAATSRRNPGRCRTAARSCLAAGSWNTPVRPSRSARAASARWSANKDQTRKGTYQLVRPFSYRLLFERQAVIFAVLDGCDLIAAVRGKALDVFHGGLIVDQDLERIGVLRFERLLDHDHGHGAEISSCINHSFSPPASSCCLHKIRPARSRCQE